MTHDLFLDDMNRKDMNRNRPGFFARPLGLVIALAAAAFLLTASIGQGQSPRAAANGAVSQQLICTISAFFSVDSDEHLAGPLQIEGRGLASCKNDQGFRTDLPVSLLLQARAVGDWTNAGELSFSANSSSFVIPREIAQLQDSYRVKSFASDFSDPSSPTLLVEGTEHDLIMDVRLSSSTAALQRIEIAGFTLGFDETAPTLE
jgi:hypothetical protein